jgi:hypothetical protein
MVIKLHNKNGELLTEIDMSKIKNFKYGDGVQIGDYFYELDKTDHKYKTVEENPTKH